MSNNLKNWQIKNKIPAEISDSFPKVNNVILQLFYNRGLTDKKQIDDFLNPDFEKQLFDPFLFKDMEQALKRLFIAVEKRERVLVYGDYDADGVCSTGILYAALKGLGLEVETYIPFRETEGYGLNTKIVQQIIDQKFSLVFTVDCGVSNVAEITLLRDAGIDVIVLDHHDEPLELPPAYALINPNIKSSGYPVSPLCGAGVVFKFLQAIIIWQDKVDSSIKLPPGFEKWLLDLVAIATVGDIVPLIGENRVLVKFGLVVLSKTKNLGLKSLMATINNRSNGLDTEYVGWRLVPRLNAAGRINHASAAFYLLSAKTEEEAGKFADILEENNRIRQQMTDKIMLAAEEQLGEVTEDSKALIAVGDSWPAGVVGLVAGRLADKYHRPVLVFSRDREKFVASGRSIEEFDITAALKECHDLLARYGGHPQACGLTILGEENFNKFKEKFLGLAEKKLVSQDLRPVVEIEAEIKLSQISWDLIKEIKKFEPFGEGNPQPLFLAKGLNIEQIQTVGADGKHLKVLVSQDNDLKNIHKLIGFSFGDWCVRLKAGDKIDIIFELGVNEWNGNKELQLKIVDLKLSNVK
jgi:single-stranded-DNA-specific exonuclease